ncbi:hypothetical protein FAGAP_944 [Fusarium agapanthi]|uniref:Uncharacterized protein n=1 Tax=Fusarium agapanthi TaxID=1803897 RepID=A0A9P5EGX4_9HYPO|nr:hypothetical protein FAGAP_944 [Fusarium agapanthi]
MIAGNSSSTAAKGALTPAQPIQRCYCDYRTSPDAQAYIDNFHILFSALTYAGKCRIRKQTRIKGLLKANLRSLTRAGSEYKAVPTMVCTELALFRYRVSKAAIDDLSARRVMDFARHEADALRELEEEEGGANEDIVALKDNVNWMVELVALWIDAAN